jgi:hypothetical protein
MPRYVNDQYESKQNHFKCIMCGHTYHNDDASDEDGRLCKYCEVKYS